MLATRRSARPKRLTNLAAGKQHDLVRLSGYARGDDPDGGRRFLVRLSGYARGEDPDFDFLPTICKKLWTIGHVGSWGYKRVVVGVYTN